MIFKSFVFFILNYSIKSHILTKSSHTEVSQTQYHKSMNFSVARAAFRTEAVEHHSRCCHFSAKHIFMHHSVVHVHYF